MKLFEESSTSSSSSEDEQDGRKPGLSINKAFAKQFDTKNQELEALKEQRKLLRDGFSSDDDNDEEEDEIAEDLTPDLDLKIHETLRLIREKDPKIYDKNFRPFENINESGKSVAKLPKEEEKKKKPLQYKDMIIQRAEAGELLDESDEEDDDESRKKAVGLSYVKEQEILKKNFKEKLLEMENKEENNGELLIAKQNSMADGTTNVGKTHTTTTKKEEEFKKNIEQLKPKQVDANEAFLWKYISDRAWMVKEENEPDLIKQAKAKLAEEEEEVEREEQFEHAYNFRFEEPNSNVIVSHPRTIEESLRREKPSKRKLERERKKEKEKKELEKKQQKLNELKNLKKKIVKDKLMKAFLNATSKQDKVEKMIEEKFTVDDIDEDFDAEKWDKKMGEIFNDEYYDEEDDDAGLLGDEEEEQQPEEEENELEKKVKETAMGIAEVVGEGKLKQGKKMAKEKKKVISKLIDESATKIVEEESELEEEDGDEAMKTAAPIKFRYKKVEPQDFGLTEEEILLAPDPLLNSYVGLKRLAPYREKEWQAASKHTKKFRYELKKYLQEKEQEEQKKGKKKSKKKHKLDSEAKDEEEEEEKKKRRLDSYKI